MNNSYIVLECYDLEVAAQDANIKDVSEWTFQSNNDPLLATLVNARGTVKTNVCKFFAESEKELQDSIDDSYAAYRQSWLMEKDKEQFDTPPTSKGLKRSRTSELAPPEDDPEG